MNIVLTSHFSPWSPYHGGGQHSTHNLATALSRRGHQVTAVYTRPPWETPAVPEAIEYDIRWAVFPTLRSSRSAALRFTVPVFVARIVRGALEPSTIVHSSGDEAALLPRLRRRRLFPFVLTPRFPWYPVEMPLSASDVVGRTRLLLRHSKFVQLGIALRAADKVCPTSKSAADQVRRAYGVQDDRLEVVPNGVPEIFRMARWRGDATGPIVFFGRLSYAKGADVLLRALAMLERRTPGCVIVGRGEQERALRRLAIRLGIGDRVEFRPWMAPGELATLLTNASLAVLPSREESFGNAIAEALSTGIPVISTDVGSVPELIIHARSGFLVQPNDPAALSEAIKNLEANPRLAKSLGENARQELRARLSWDSVAEAFERIYLGLLHPRTG